jgi:hypothetical protein
MTIAIVMAILLLAVALGRGALVLWYARSRSYQAKQALAQRLEGTYGH